MEPFFDQGWEILINLTDEGGGGQLRGKYLAETRQRFEIELLQDLQFIEDTGHSINVHAYRTGEQVFVDKPLIKSIELPGKGVYWYPGGHKP